MTSPDSKELKKQLIASCIHLQNLRIENFRKAMDEAQQSANSEERSTAGDKHDTARAMSQNEREMNAKHLQEAVKDLTILQQINSNHIFEIVKPGAIVKTGSGNYFISISVGKIKSGDEVFFAISVNAPVATALLNKRKSDTFSFRGKTETILEVF